MANKSANVNARVEPEVKKKAEEILEEIGVPVSVSINMFYRQIIFCHGLPFRPVAPEKAPKALDEMTKDEFDARMEQGLSEAKAGIGLPADQAFDILKKDLNV